MVVEAAGIDIGCMFPEAIWAAIIGEGQAELQVDIEGICGCRRGPARCWVCVVWVAVIDCGDCSDVVGETAEGKEVMPRGAIAGVGGTLVVPEAMTLAIDFPESSLEGDCIL